MLATDLSRNGQGLYSLATSLLVVAIGSFGLWNYTQFQSVRKLNICNVGSRFVVITLFITSRFLQRKPQQDATVCQHFIIPYFKWSSTFFGRHTAHHQEPKTAQAASGFAYVECCRTCSCWTLPGSCLTTSNNCPSDNLPHMQNQRLFVQFYFFRILCFLVQKKKPKSALCKNVFCSILLITYIFRSTHDHHHRILTL